MSNHNLLMYTVLVVLKKQRMHYITQREMLDFDTFVLQRPGPRGASGPPGPLGAPGKDGTDVS